jgi:acyl-coenzyme A synthetase/AMP-(fatty) acid ligase
LRLRRESVKKPVERARHEPPPEFANVGFQLLETVAQSRGYAITNVDSLGVIERFTFAEIMRETAQWAQLLREKGLQPGDRVVIVTGREWGWRCALLGAMRAGGVAVPCPASLPLREIGAVAAHAGASFLVALRPRPDLVELDGHVALTAVDLDDVDPSRALQQPPHRTEARDIALILYAWRGLDLSGTMHSHASLLAQADAGEHWLGIGADERIWATADDGSGPSIWLLLAGWHRAASIVVVDLELDSDAKLELLDRLRSAAVWFSDDEYRLLGSAEVPPWVDLGSIRRAFVDTDETEGAAAFSAAFGAALVPVFTLDELGIMAGWPNGQESRADARTAQPAPGVQLAVVGEDGTELPPGEIGDVVVRGDAPTLFTGYAGREGRSRSAEWFRFGWRGTLTAEGALRLEARAPSEVLPADASADIPVPEVAEAPPPEEPVARQETEVEDRREEDAAREQAEHEAAEARAADVRLRAEQAAMALAAAEAEERRRAEERGREEERQREERLARGQADQEAKERAKAEADERRQAEEGERLEAMRRMEEEKRSEEERRREEKAARARADQEAKEREEAEAEERRRAEEDAKTQAKLAEAEAKQRAKDEKERERREAEAAKEQARIDAAEAKQRAKDEKEREKREAIERAEREKAAAEAAKVQAKVDAAEAKQRAKDEKEREKREAIERAEREKAAAEAAKVQAKVDAAEAKQRAKDEKEREKREAVERAEREKAAAEAAKAQQKQAEVEAKQRAEEDKRRAKEREREEKEARRRADQEAKEAARAERKPAFGRRRQEAVEEPEREPEHVPDVVARIQQYGMAAASTERPAEPPEQSEDE